jgi:glycosyltransferase involved in cell wall biosynthesis
MLVANDTSRDSRVRKSARTLARHGYRVTVLGAAPPGHHEARIRMDGFDLWLAAAGRSKDSVRDDLREVSKEWKRANRRLAKTMVRAESRSFFDPRWAISQLELRHALATYAEVQERYADVLTRYEPGARPSRIAALTDRWTEQLRELGPDLIHVHDHHPLEAGIAYAGRHDVPVVYDAHEYLRGRQESALSKHQPWIVEDERRWAPLADAVITVSEPLADILQSELGLRTRPVVVLNAPRIADREPPPVRLREVIGLAAATPLVVYAGGLNARRGIDVAIRSLALLPGVHLGIVAPTAKAYAKELDALRHELGVADRVHFAPLVSVESVVPYLADADVGIFTPLDDGVNRVAMPNKLFEYLHAGLALVTRDLGEIGRFVRLTGAGETTDGTAEDTARAIRTVLGQPERYTEGRDALVAAWSWEAQERRLVGVYESLARRRRGVVPLPARVGPRGDRPRDARTSTPRG